MICMYFEPLQIIFTRFTPRGKYLPPPNSRGILPTWANFTPRGKCVHMTNFAPRGKFAPRGICPQGQTYAYKRGISLGIIRNTVGSIREFSSVRLGKWFYRFYLPPVLLHIYFFLHF